MWLDDESDQEDSVVSPQWPSVTVIQSGQPEIEFDEKPTVEDLTAKRARLLRELSEISDPEPSQPPTITTADLRRCGERLLEEFRVEAMESLRSVSRSILEAARVHERAVTVLTITAAESDERATSAHSHCVKQLADLSLAADRAEEALMGSTQTRELVLSNSSDPSGHAACLASDASVDEKLEAVTDRIARLTQSKQAGMLGAAGTAVSVQAGNVSHAFWATRQQHRQSLRLDLSDRLQNHLRESQARSMESVDSLHQRRRPVVDGVSAQIAKAAADLQQRMNSSTSDLIRSTQAVVSDTALAADEAWTQRRDRLEQLHARMVENAEASARDLETAARRRFGHETTEMSRLYSGNFVGSVVTRALPSVEFRPPAIEALPSVPEVRMNAKLLSEPLALASLDGLRASLRQRRSALPEYSELCVAAADASSTLDFSAARIDLEKIAGVHRQWLAECRAGPQLTYGSEQLEAHSFSLESAVALASKARADCEALRGNARSAASACPSETLPELGKVAGYICESAASACVAVKSLIEASAAAAVEHGKLSAEALILDQLRSESMDRQRAAKERLQELSETLRVRRAESMVQSSALDQSSTRFAESQASTRLESSRSGYTAEASS